MCLQHAAGISAPLCPGMPVASNKTASAYFSPIPGTWQPGDAVLCGQSRTTVKTRHFAALIGRLWVGGC
jgi:hypothetical protein